jgi:hypothetical protein
LHEDRKELKMKYQYRTGATIHMYLFLCIISLSGCASRTPIEPVTEKPIDRETLKYQNVLFREFKAAPQVKSPSTAIQQCRDSAISHLKRKNLFKRVEASGKAPGEGKTLFVDATITSLRIVSGGARFWAGAMAGRSHMKIQVRLIDGESDSLVAEKELFGAPSAMGGAWSVGGTDKALPGRMGIFLGDYVLSNVHWAGALTNSMRV